MMGKRVLVTGSEGFVGKWLVKALKDKGIEVIPFDAAQGKSVIRWEDFSSIKGIDAVFHLAALTYVPEARKNPRPFFEVNGFGTLNVCELCRIHNAKLIYASSYLYGKPTTLPISEEHPLDLYNPYAQSKFIGEEIISQYEREFGLKAVKLRFFNIYGPGQRQEFIISRIARSLKTGVVELQDPRPKRDFVYVSDVVQAYLKAYSSQQTGVFNIGSGKSYSVREIVRIMVSIWGKPVKIIFSGDRRPNEILDCVSDIRKARRLLGWSPKVDIDDGLKKTIAREGLQE